MSSKEALAQIFESIRSKLARVVQGIVPPKEIEDIVQETYIRVCQVSAPDQIKSPRSFMYRTARNLALDYAKRSETRLVDSYDELAEMEAGQGDSSIDETFNRASSDQEFAHFCEAVRFLPSQCRRAFVLKKVYGYSQREIATIMGVSEKTVEKHIANGLKRSLFYLRQRQHEAAGITLPAKRGVSS